MNIESRWPAKSVAEAKDLTKISVAVAVTWEGASPPSAHALCDLLDSAAQSEAESKGKRVKASGEARKTKKGMSRDYWIA